METKAKFEHIAATGDASFRCFLIESNRFNHPLHYHPELELTLVLDSVGQRVVGDSVKPFGRGDLCLLGGNLPHLYHNSPTSRRRKGARAIVVQFRRDFGGGVLDAAAEFQDIARLLDRAAQGLEFSPEVVEAVQPSLERLLLATGSERLLLLFELLATLAGAPATGLASAGYRPSLGRPKSERISKACQFIFEHYHEEISQEQVARRIGLSPSAFTRFFQRHTQQTYQHFLSEVRLGHASRLLLHTDQSVTEIAFASGFQNLANFHRRFRQRYGATPLAYRKAAERLRTSAENSGQFS